MREISVVHNACVQKKLHMPSLQQQQVVTSGQDFLSFLVVPFWHSLKFPLRVALPVGRVANCNSFMRYLNQSVMSNRYLMMFFSLKSTFEVEVIDNVFEEGKASKNNALIITSRLDWLIKPLKWHAD